tara:strand:- start:2222 stop:2632 length:411 start_codon:yes stop_codon:yes gene_type:complete
MNRIIRDRKIFLMIFFLMQTGSLVAEMNCKNYPYPKGISIVKNKNNKKQFVFTKSKYIRTNDPVRINYLIRHSNFLAMYSLRRHLDNLGVKKDEKKSGLFQLKSCFSKKGLYKVSYIERKILLKDLNLKQKENIEK